MNKEELQDYVVRNLDRALEDGRIQAYYQPIVRGSSGLVCDEEALARWIEPDGSMLRPDEFIPPLESAGLIYKLDLHILDCLLKDACRRRDAGLYVVPCSINLSREDFECVDIVEEIRKRVDEAGLERDRVNIEITESVIGSDFEYMRDQIRRFRTLGFPVWMDDFGKGYSSLDLLQKLDVDVLKLDMGFLQEYETNKKTKIILTQLVKLAVDLGIDTVAEGVESAEQTEFLSEIGCTKLQGFHYCKPVSVDEIIRRNEDGRQIGFENPDESPYYEAIGRISLYDLDDVSVEEASALRQYFDALPVAILEYNGERLVTARSNRSYKEFLKQYFGIYDTGRDFDHVPIMNGRAASIFRLIEQSRHVDRRLMFEEKIGDHTIITGFIRHSADNQISGNSAYTVAILSARELEHNTEVTFVHAAKALSSDYINLFVVNTETDEFSEFTPDPVNGQLSAERQGSDFFDLGRGSSRAIVYPKDYERFISEFTKDNILKEIEAGGVFTIVFRVIDGGAPVYVNLKAVKTDSEHIVIGITNVDTYMRHREALERVREESITYARIAALSGEYVAIYTVDPANGDYKEYSATKEFENLGLVKKGTAFFEETLRLSHGIVYPDDLDMFLAVCTKENIMKGIEQAGLFEFSYRLMLGGKPVHVSLKAAMVEEKDGPRIIVGISNIEENVRRRQEYEASLMEVRRLVTIDVLTGVKNKHAYVDVEAELDELIENGEDPEFAVVVCDINGLKIVNDAHGHQTGDNYIKAGCKVVCDIFDHSPVFRVGGDEFAVIARGRDYDNIDKLLEEMEEHNRRCLLSNASLTADPDGKAGIAKNMTAEAGKHIRGEGAVTDYTEASAGEIYDFDPSDVMIACGMARFDGDRSVAAVFDRADLAMYENKTALKEKAKERIK